VIFSISSILFFKSSTVYSTVSTISETAFLGSNSLKTKSPFSMIKELILAFNSCIYSLVGEEATNSSTNLVILSNSLLSCQLRIL